MLSTAVKVWLAAALLALLTSGCGASIVQEEDGENSGKVTTIVYDGYWTGNGKASTQGLNTDCDDVSLRISQKEKSLMLVGGKYACGALSSTWDSMTFEIRNDETLYLNGQRVGTISDKTIKILLQEPADGSSLQLTVNRLSRDTMKVVQIEDRDGLEIRHEATLTLQD